MQIKSLSLILCICSNLAYASLHFGIGASTFSSNGNKDSIFPQAKLKITPNLTFGWSYNKDFDIEITYASLKPESIELEGQMLIQDFLDRPYYAEKITSSISPQTSLKIKYQKSLFKNSNIFIALGYSSVKSKIEIKEAYAIKSYDTYSFDHGLKVKTTYDIDESEKYHFKNSKTFLAPCFGIGFSQIIYSNLSIIVEADLVLFAQPNNPEGIEKHLQYPSSLSFRLGLEYKI